MTFVSLGDLAQSLQLRRENGALKVEMQRLATELATGRRETLAVGRSGDFGALASLEQSLSALSAYKVSAGEAALVAQSSQTVLAKIAGGAEVLSSALLVAQSMSQPAVIDSVGSDARQRFEAMVTGLNTAVAGRSLFAGQAINGPALADPGTLLADLQTAVAGATTAADVVTAVEAWFAPGSGFETMGYLGGAPEEPARLGVGATAEPTVRAIEPEILATLRGVAMAALLDVGVLAGDADERSELARAAGEDLVDAASDLVTVQSRIGVAEGSIAEVQAGIATEVSALEIARSDIVNADPFETATRLAEAERQLESLYLVTGRLSALSLADYLR